MVKTAEYLIGSIGAKVLLATILIQDRMLLACLAAWAQAAHIQLHQSAFQIIMPIMVIIKTELEHGRGNRDRMHYLYLTSLFIIFLCQNLSTSNLMQRKGKQINYVLSPNMFSSHGNVHEIKAIFILTDFFLRKL